MAGEEQGKQWGHIAAGPMDLGQDSASHLERGRSPGRSEPTRNVI